MSMHGKVAQHCKAFDSVHRRIVYEALLAGQAR
jgi:hypothetical protein